MTKVTRNLGARGCKQNCWGFVRIGSKPGITLLAAWTGKAKADALREAGLEAYHDKGDEFLCRGNHIKELLAKLERARAILRDCTIVARSSGLTIGAIVTGAVNAFLGALKKHG